MKRATILVFLLLITTTVFSTNKYSKINITDKLYLIKISEKAYVHVSYMNDDIPCNGFIFVDNGKAFIMETPKEIADTKLLLDYIKNNLKLEVAGFVTNDWHSDSMGGVSVFNDAGIPTYAHQMTIDIAKTKNIPLPVNSFKDSIELKLNDKSILCYYLGAAHTMDNIVTWIPSQKILFAGCMVKEIIAENLGFTDDGDVKEYAETLKKVMRKFTDAQFVIPGHGNFGGMELLEHSLKMAEKLR